MAVAEQPKKPAGGAFGRYLAENRAELAKECVGKPAVAVTKLGAERFRALGEAKKAEYQDKFKQAQEQYAKDMEAFLAAGGMKKERKRKAAKGEEGKRKRQKKDPEAPKRPAGGAYGCYLAKHRAELMEMCKGQPITAVSKLAGERWKKLNEEERKPFEEEYKVKQAAYTEAMKSYVPPAAPEGVEKPDKKEAKRLAKEEAKQAKEEAKQAKQGTKQAAKEEAKRAKDEVKRAKAEAKSAAKAKAKPEAKGRFSTAVAKSRGRGRGGRPAKPQAATRVELQTTVATKAEKLGLSEKLVQLASRQDIIDSGKCQTQMLKALEESQGLIHPAKRALLGA